MADVRFLYLLHIRDVRCPNCGDAVVDEGKWKPAQRREERGRGLPLMRALTHAVEIRTHATQTEVRLRIPR